MIRLPGLLCVPETLLHSIIAQSQMGKWSKSVSSSRTQGEIQQSVNILRNVCQNFIPVWLSANHDQQTMVGILLIDQRMLQNLIDLFRSVQTLEDIAKVIGNDKAMVVRCGEKCSWEVYTMVP